MINYHALKSEVKSAILVQFKQIKLAEDPLLWVWLLSALILEGTQSNSIVENALDAGKQWLKSDETWDTNKHLGSIGFLCCLMQQVKGRNCQEEIQRVNERLQGLKLKGARKYSYFNDPQFVYPLVSGMIGHFSRDLHSWLKQHCEQNAQPSNKWSRRLLFRAAARELGSNISPLVINSQELEAYEIIMALWFAEHYSDLVDDETRRALWDSFKEIQQEISLDNSDCETKYSASPIELAMLYKAVANQTRSIDPVSLFNNFSWHPEIRKVSESLFLKGEYVNAVFEAAKFFVDAVKHKAGHPVDSAGKPMDGVVLMQSVFQKKNTLLKFNNLSNQTEENEQQGLCWISQGVVSVFRNPKAHVPALGIKLSPEEAFEQLAILSYLMRRLDTAKRK